MDPRTPHARERRARAGIQAKGIYREIYTRILLQAYMRRQRSPNRFGAEPRPPQAADRAASAPESPAMKPVERPASGSGLEDHERLTAHFEGLRRRLFRTGPGAGLGPTCAPA